MVYHNTKETHDEIYAQLVLIKYTSYFLSYDNSNVGIITQSILLELCWYSNVPFLPLIWLQVPAPLHENNFRVFKIEDNTTIRVTAETTFINSCAIQEIIY